MPRMTVDDKTDFNRIRPAKLTKIIPGDLLVEGPFSEPAEVGNIRLSVANQTFPKKQCFDFDNQ